MTEQATFEAIVGHPSMEELASLDQVESRRPTDARPKSWTAPAGVLDSSHLGRTIRTPGQRGVLIALKHEIHRATGEVVVTLTTGKASRPTSQQYSSLDAVVVTKPAPSI